MNEEKHKLLYLTVSPCNNHRFASIDGARGAVIHDTKLFLNRHLNEFFSEVITYDYLKDYFDLGSTLANQKIIKIVEKERPQLVLWQSLSLHCEIDERTLKNIRQYGCKIIAIFWDDEAIFDCFTKFYLPCVDYYLTTDRNSVKKAAIFGNKGYHLDAAADPMVHRKLNIPYAYDVSFVGTRFLERENAINEVKKAGIDVRVFGNGWNRIIPTEEMVEVFNKSKINLNFTTNAINKNIRQVKCRFFEVCMCGGFLLSEYAEGIEQVYDIGREIVCFDNVKEAIEKIKFYLTHEDLRQEIAENGYRRAISEHSWQAHLTKVFSQILNDKNFPPRVNVSDFLSKDKIFPLASDFHLKWAITLLLKGGFKDKNIKARYFDELRLALEYNPNSLGAIMLYNIRFLPISVSKILVKLYMQLFIMPKRYIITLIKLEGSIGYKLNIVREKLLKRSKRTAEWIQ